jgi:hypothetical protein
MINCNEYSRSKQLSGEAGCTSRYFIIPVLLSMLFFAAAAGTEDQPSGNNPAA